MRQITKKQLLGLAVAISRDHSSNAILDYTDFEHGLLLPFWLYSDELSIITRRLSGIMWSISPVRSYEECSSKYFLRISICSSAFKE